MKKNLLWVLAVPPALAAAQEDPVVVTATRTARPSLEVPASVDRVYAEDIRQGRPRVNLSESLGAVPGILVQNRQNYAQDLQVQSRGFGARATFGVRGIRLLADGIPASMPDGQGQAATFALGSAERIEVLRGPFSSMYGNASGGVISVDTEDGPREPTVWGDVSAGSFDTWRAATKFGGQWGRVNGLGELSHFDTGGYRDHSAATRDQANAKLKIGLQDKSSLTLVANALEQPDTQDPLGLTRAEYQADATQATPNALAFNTRKSISHQQLGATFDRTFTDSRLQATAYGGQRTVQQFLAIPLATQAAPTHSGGVVDLDRSFSGLAVRYFNDLARNLRFSLGADYEQMSEHRRGYVNNFGVQGALKRDEDDTVASTGLYVQAEWKLADRWTAHGGLRSSHVRFRTQDHFIVPGNPDDSGEKSYDATTPVLGLLFRPNERTTFYGTFGRGFETPTFAELANVNPPATGLNFGLEASRSRHLEAGVKAVLPAGLRLNAALFSIVTENEIVVDQSSGGRSTFRNAGHTDRDGVEIGAETLSTGPWRLRVAYTYLDAVFRESFNTVAGTPAVPVTVPAGSQLPGVPKSVLYGELRFQKEQFYAWLEGLYKARVPVNDQNSEFADAYTTLNFVVGLLQGDARWSVSEFLRVDNLSDKNYVGSVVVNDANNRYYEPSPRRNYTLGIQASLRF
ncbi:MAG: TonB-dependent receptor family protein, partial [Burkholderiales bacterium]